MPCKLVRYKHIWSVVWLISSFKLYFIHEGNGYVFLHFDTLKLLQYSYFLCENLYKWFFMTVLINAFYGIFLHFFNFVGFKVC